MQIYLLHFNKNSSTAVPSRNERYEEFLRYTNKKTKLFKINNGRWPITRFIGEFTVSSGADRSERSEEWYCLFLKKVDTIIRSLRLLERAAFGTREALMERREAPYPYSKICELCELCELLEKKNPTALRWDFLIYPQQNLFVGRGVLRSPF